MYAAVLVVHLLTAQQVIKYFCPARSQTILQTPADQKPKDNDFSLQDKPEAEPQAARVGKPIILVMKHLYQLI